jgi:hypothetical protein
MGINDQIWGSDILCVVGALIFGGNAYAGRPGKVDYLAECARCHGVDRKGEVRAMS